MEEVIVDKKIGGVIATYTIEKDFRTWNELGINDFKVDNLIEFLSLLPKGEFEFNNENDESVVEFDTLDDIDEFLSYSMEITGDPYGKDKEGVISFYVVYNGEDNHETFKLLVDQFNLNDYFEYEIKLKKIPKKEIEKKQSYLTEEIRKEEEDEDHMNTKVYFPENALIASIKYLPQKKWNSWSNSNDAEITYYHPNGAVSAKINVKKAKFYGGNYMEYHDNGKIALIINFPKVGRVGDLMGEADLGNSFHSQYSHKWHVIPFSYYDFDEFNTKKFYRLNYRYEGKLENRVKTSEINGFDFNKYGDTDYTFKYPFKKYDREGNLIAEQDSNNNFYEYKSNGDIISKKTENETFIKDDEGRILFLNNKETKNYIYHPNQSEEVVNLVENGVLKKYKSVIEINDNDEVVMLYGSIHKKIVKNGDDWMSTEYKEERYDIKGSEYIDNLISECRNEIANYLIENSCGEDEKIEKLVKTITNLEKTPVSVEEVIEPLDGKQKLFLIGSGSWGDDYVILARDKNHMYKILSVKGYSVKDDTLYNPMGNEVRRVREVENVYGATKLRDN